MQIVFLSYFYFFFMYTVQLRFQGNLINIYLSIYLSIRSFVRLYLSIYLSGCLFKFVLVSS